MHLHSPRPLELERSLRAVAGRLDRAADGSWRGCVVNGVRTTFHAELDSDNWIAVSAPCVAPARSWWALLRVNAALDGCVRVACTTGGGLEVRGDIALDDDWFPDAGADGPDAALDHRIAQLCDDIVSVAHQVSLAPAAHQPASTPTPAGDSMERAGDAAAIVRLCGEAGWDAVAPGTGEVSVRLDTPVSDVQATLALVGGGLRAWAPLTMAQVTAAESEQAIGRLLLDAGRHLRAVKGVVVAQGGIERPGIALAGGRRPPTAATIHRALAALSVASATVAREVRALQDAPLARDYLTLRGRHGAGPARVLHGSHDQEDSPCLPLP